MVDFLSEEIGSSASSLGWAGTTNGLPYATVAVDPENAGNQVLRVTGSTQNNGVYLNLAAAQIIERGETGTVFFRVLFASDADHNVSVGFGNTANNYNSVQGNFRFRNAENWTVSHGTNPTAAASNPSAREVETWYNVWMVINPEGGVNKWEAYIQPDGGTQTQIVTGAANTLFTFKDGNGVDAATDRLVIYFGTTSGVELGEASPVYLDDFYIDPTGKNLANPIPEASSWAWLSMGGLTVGWLVSRRKFRKG